MAVVFYLLFDVYELYNFKRKFHRKGKVLDGITNSIRKLLKKGRIDVIDEKLEKAGRPFSLTPETYIMAKIGLFVFALVYMYLVDMQGLQAVLFGVLSLLALDIYIYFRKKDIEKAFRDEMPEVVDVFEIGATADIPLEDTFLLATNFAERKEVKKELAKLSAEYFITKNKEGCLCRFANNVGLSEVNVLTMSILQGEKTGKVKEILSSLSKSLYNTAISKAAREGKMMEYKVLAATFVLMASIFMLYMYPYFTNLEGGLRTIF